MPRNRPRLLAFAACFSLVLVPALAAQRPDRITERVDNSRTFPLLRALHPAFAATALGPLSPNIELARMTLHLSVPSAQRRELDQLLRAEQDRSNPQYHHWLTPKQYAERFGASEHDIAKIVTWLNEQGFRDVQPSRSRTRITFAGSVATAEAAFQGTLTRYRINGELHYANATPPILPRAFESLAHNITGLNDLRPHPTLHSTLHPVAHTAVLPHYASATGFQFVTPADFSVIYDISSVQQAGTNGAGVSIAVPGQSDITLSQIAAFRSAAGLPSQTTEVRAAGADPGIQPSSQMEGYADVEWAGAEASAAQLIYVTSANYFDALQYAIDNDLAPIVSVSYGSCEADIANDIDDYEEMFQQAAAQGITVIASSGDLGPAACEASGMGVSAASHGLAVNYPASSQYVTGIGGTMFPGASGARSSTNGPYGASAQSYPGELVWNEHSRYLLASGGGSSAFIGKPAWQTGPGVPSDAQRDVPDLAFNASVLSNPYIVCANDGTVQATACTNGFLDSNGSIEADGGTSLASQAFAGIVALLVQQQGRQGNINLRLYTLAANYPAAFHDITAGNNDVRCVAGSPDCPTAGEIGYPATSGYDPVTGLGSVDAAQLLANWNPDFSLTLTPNAIAIAASSSASATIAVSAIGNLTAPIAFTCSVSSALANTTCSVPASLTAGNSGTVTIANGNASQIASWFRMPPAVLLAYALCAVLLAFVVRKRRPRFASAIDSICLCIVLCAVMMSCGGMSSDPTSDPQTRVPISVTGAVTITGAADGKTHSVTLTVTEN